MSNQRISLIHPFVIAIYPVLYIYSLNEGLIRIETALRTLAFMVLVTGFLLWVLRFLVSQLATRALLVSMFYILFFSYSGLYLALMSVPGVVSLMEPGRFSLLYFAAYLVLAVFVVHRADTGHRILTAGLNIVAMVLFVFGLVQIGTSHWPSLRTDWRSAANRIIETNLQQELSPIHGHPDIYYIILDGYARADVLREIYQFDNGPFLEQLISDGFYIPRQSRSNYLYTYLSLASSLNLTYLDGLTETLSETGASYHRPLRYLIERNSAAQLLKELGYSFVFLSSGYSATNSSSLADVCLCKLYGFTELEDSLIVLTPFGTWAPGGFPRRFQFNAHRQQILDTFDELSSLPDRTTPKFVFAHLVIPHPPFVFGPNGGALGHDAPFFFNDDIFYTGSREEYIQGYRDQVAYLNTELEKTVKTILARSQSPPIIILQADHGPRSPIRGRDLSHGEFRERFGIFAAYYLPQDGDRQLYDTITPVNTFRLLFNHYFNGRYEVLPDKSYISTSDHPYKFRQFVPRDSGAANQTARITVQHDGQAR